jgi:hypothetical protein
MDFLFWELRALSIERFQISVVVVVVVFSGRGGRMMGMGTEMEGSLTVLDMVMPMLVNNFRLSIYKL